MKIIITGSGGLVGGTAVRYFSDLSCEIIGIDNNYRQNLFGDKASVFNDISSFSSLKNYKHLNLDIRNKDLIFKTIKEVKPDVIIHCAGQPSHEKSSSIPYEDFEINTLGTMNLLEAMRTHSPNCSFIFTSTNKVYGENPNTLYEIYETPKRYDFKEFGIDENCPIDNTIHSPFGANKLSADVIVQEYGKYYGLNTVCFRCGCITGKTHKGVEQHGFLSYLCKTFLKQQEYKIYGFKGKQVRDNIHAFDLVNAFHNYILSPRKGEFYNIGGGRENSCSILESLDIMRNISNKNIKISFEEKRKGDHICYMTDNRKFQSHYPNWKKKFSLQMIFEEQMAV
ncbi:MAG: NAD-dependent epimerase/dehydratase family protein [Neisseriaceae bacterium]|nr:MAG: NAD-dependent epimerase/dehydratase family protein [Neisseriaceae bacterium]